MCVDNLEDAYRTLKRVVNEYLMLEEKEGGAMDDQGEPFASSSTPKGGATAGPDGF